jgi:hypothetical protein
MLLCPKALPPWIWGLAKVRATCDEIDYRSSRVEIKNAYHGHEILWISLLLGRKFQESLEYIVCRC